MLSPGMNGVARSPVTSGPADMTGGKRPSYRVESETPRFAALTVTAAGVRFKDFAILSRPAFCFAIVLSVLRSSLDHNTRTLFFLAISHSSSGTACKNRLQQRQGRFTGNVSPFLAGLPAFARRRYANITFTIESLRRQTWCSGLSSRQSFCAGCGPPQRESRPP
jgi:hypothetical protein